MNQDWITSFEALKRVYLEDAYSNIAINEAIPHHKGCRDSFVRTMVKGTIRDTIRLDSIIESIASGGIRSIKKRTLIILRMGLYALRSMDSVPDHAAVNEAVALARKVARGTERFVNAVLRSYIREKAEFEQEPERLALRYSFPQDLADLIIEQYDDEAESILKGLTTPPPLVLRANTLKTTAEKLSSELTQEGFSIRTAEESPRALIAEGSGVLSSDLYRKGNFTVQSLSSIMAIEKLAPEPGSKVLDMCAAPGGKTTLMAEIMENQGCITACDIHEHRLKLVEKTAARLGAGCIGTRLLDGTEHDCSLDNCFDYVLADVPCSGLGVIGSKPEIMLKADPAAYPALCDIQLEILKNAVRYAKPGGLIEYSTCTINRNENERIIARLTDDPDSGFGRFVSIVEMRTVLPYNNLVGFFYCILRKNA